MAGAQPVCGVDGLTYLGECVAVCQGVAVARKGACTAAHDGIFNPSVLQAQSGAAFFGDNNVNAVVDVGVLTRCVLGGGQLQSRT